MFLRSRNKTIVILSLIPFVAFLSIYSLLCINYGIGSIAIDGYIYMLLLLLSVYLALNNKETFVIPGYIVSASILSENIIKTSFIPYLGVLIGAVLTVYYTFGIILVKKLIK